MSPLRGFGRCVGSTLHPAGVEPQSPGLALTLGERGVKQNRTPQGCNIVRHPCGVWVMRLRLLTNRFAVVATAFGS